MSPEPTRPDPSPPPEPTDYVHAHDAQSDRARVELWAILAIVAVVVVGALVWRAATGHRSGPTTGWNETVDRASNPGLTPAAGAGLPPHGVGTPPPRPLAP